MGSTEYLYAVQDATGVEVVSWKGVVAKVGEVTVARHDDGAVQLVRGGDVLSTGKAPREAALTLHRWPAAKKLDEHARVSKPVR